MEEKIITKLILQKGNLKSEYTNTSEDGCTIDEIVSAFFGACVGITFLPETVIKGMKDFVDNYCKICRFDKIDTQLLCD